MEQAAKKRILIADDDRMVIRLLGSHLETKGFTVIACNDGTEVLEAIRQQLPDLIILDMMMPKMDGMKACAMIKVDRRFLHIPIIIATASADTGTRETSVHVGANGFVNKPLKMAEIDAKISELLALPASGSPSEPV